MKAIIIKQLPDLILEKIEEQEFLKRYNEVSWVDEYERVNDPKGTKVAAELEILHKYDIDSSSAPVFKIKNIVFQLSNFKQVKNQQNWSLGPPNMRVVGTISDIELELDTAFDDKSNRIDKIKIINCKFDIDKLNFHPR